MVWFQVDIPKKLRSKLKGHLSFFETEDYAEFLQFVNKLLTLLEKDTSDFSKKLFKEARKLPDVEDEEEPKRGN